MSLCSSSCCSEILSVDQAGLKPTRDPPASAFQELALKACTIIHGSKKVFNAVYLYKNRILMFSIFFKTPEFNRGSILNSISRALKDLSVENF